MTTSALDSFSNTVNNVWQMVGNPKRKNMAFDKMTQYQLIEIGDHIQDIFGGTDILDPPVLCVIGSQSSGKSSVLNALKGLDILPKGKTIVTRTPIYERLVYVKNSKQIQIEFYSKENPQKIISSYTFDADSVNEQTLEPVRNEIIRLTNLYAGSTKDVVDQPINIKIKSPHVPSLSVIDLPGMTTIALTDKGQSEDIKYKIENMLIKYIKNPRTIILAVIPATIDVESDMGLGLIKKYDPEFRRTIGVITKVDLLKDSDVLPFLSGDISKSLQLGYGYYAVRNRSNDEAKTMSAVHGYELENKFFSETIPYKDSADCRLRTGIINLGNRLSELMISHLRKCLPSVLEEINIKDKEIEKQLDEIGRDYPTDESGKRSMLNVLLHEFQREYNSAVKQRGARYNTGAKIAGCFMSFSSKMSKLDPFSEKIYSDKIINEIVRDYNGIHMPDMTVSTGVIEKCFQEIDKNDILTNDNTCERTSGMIDPFVGIRDLFIECIKDVQVIMCDLVDIILQRDKYSRFPKLCIRIKEIIANNSVPHRYSITCGKIDDIFIEEKECIWTDDVHFRCKILPIMFHKSTDGTIDPAIIRNILTEYFKVIRNMCNHRIHKSIRTFFVNRIVDDVDTTLTDQILLKADINQILEETKEKTIIREKLMKLKQKINDAKKIIYNQC